MAKALDLVQDPRIRNRCKAWRLVAAIAGLALGGVVPIYARAEVTPQDISDEWWTGPLLAANASTLPQGHLYLEPYVFDSRPYVMFDGEGHRQRTPREDNYGSLTYINYGLADRLTIGAIPRFGYAQMANGGHSSSVGLGDLSLQAQYRLTQFEPGSWAPTVAVNVQETLPTGRFDKLSRASDGFGEGAWSTTIGLYSQTYFWMPNGRILRARLNLSYDLGGRADVTDESVFGTPDGFRGEARIGRSVVADLAFEYSFSRNWVAAIDFWDERDGATRIAGQVASPSAASSPGAFAGSSGSSRAFIVAPAMEYNWSARMGAIFGVRVVASGRNQTATVTPVAALSVFY